MMIDKAISRTAKGLSGVHVDRDPCCSSRVARIGELKTAAPGALKALRIAADTGM
jgi:hypothetical protein